MDNAAAGCSGVFEHAPWSGIQAAGNRQRIARFCYFMERQRASYITKALALAWAQQPGTFNPHIGRNA